MTLNIPALRIACLSAGLFFAAHGASAINIPEERFREVFNDPAFVERFLGSYNPLTDAEPKINPTEAEFFKDLVQLLQVNPNAAASRLRQEVEAQPSSSAALKFILANLYFQNGQLADATKFYQEAIKSFPEFRRAHKNLGLLLVQDGQYEIAVNHLAKAVELGDRDGKNYGLMAFCYLSSDNLLAAETAYRNAVVQEPQTKDWKVGLAQTLLMQERYREARAILGKLIQDAPATPDYWLLQANAYVAEDRPLDAAVNLEIVRAMDGADIATLRLLGDIYFNLNLPGQALDVYKTIITKDDSKENLPAAMRAADLLIRYDAVDFAEQIIAVIRNKYGSELTRKEDLQLLTSSARIARARGNSEEAAALLESIVERDGTAGDALLELAKHYASTGQYEKAAMKFGHAEKLAAFEFDALVEHAKMLVKQREFTRAVRKLKDALALKDDSRIADYLSRVERAAANS